ncbi:hypothetical protein B9T33_13780 [Acinetobacter sp. ANC 5054]|uniref:hypothetical protein n=1 Tax=Acinetobacter sp. ANC 5054 TaxID=1977877 RepID=UPI000A330011|nr:hypothetical protein [Acinetobacter sp. ANC 5054]OTG79029.1 hypothetical protein B9T33_13780 [Acinetobacter sp. ANC 5054]
MSEFHKEIGTLFGITEEQSAQIEQGLKQLEVDFTSASDVGDQGFSTNFYAQFVKLVTQNGIVEDEIERLVNVLYFNEDHQQVVTYIVPSYYNSGGDRAQFEDTYQLMMDDLQQAI